MENELKVKRDRVDELRREYEDRIQHGQGLEAKVRELETKDKIDIASQKGVENKEKRLQKLIKELRREQILTQNSVKDQHTKILS